MWINCAKIAVSKDVYRNLSLYYYTLLLSTYIHNCYLNECDFTSKLKLIIQNNNQISIFNYSWKLYRVTWKLGPICRISRIFWLVRNTYIKHYALLFFLLVKNKSTIYTVFFYNKYDKYNTSREYWKLGNYPVVTHQYPARVLIFARFQDRRDHLRRFLLSLGRCLSGSVFVDSFGD